MPITPTVHLQTPGPSGSAAGVITKLPLAAYGVLDGVFRACVMTYSWSLQVWYKVLSLRVAARVGR
jgi:hypothetical protein